MRELSTSEISNVSGGGSDLEQKAGELILTGVAIAIIVILHFRED